MHVLRTTRCMAFGWRAGLVLLLSACGPVLSGQVSAGAVPVRAGGTAFSAAGPSAPGQPAISRLSSPTAPSPAEYSAYAAAMSRSPASAQVAAIQSFLRTYPQSSLAPQARKWLAMAQMREGRPTAGLAAMQPVPAPLSGRAQFSPLPQQAKAPGPQQTTPPSAQPVQRESASLPAQHAVIELRQHSLTIRADNSSLSQILRDLSATSGLKVEGLAHDQRIYGNFGPGEPQDVLISLVDGLGYNILMIGESDRGLPRQLILSPRTADAGGPAASPPPDAGSSEQDDESMQDDQSGPPEMQPAQQGRPYTPMPPQAGPGVGPNNRTTQQMLDELRRMHQPDEPQPPPDQPQQ